LPLWCLMLDFMLDAPSVGVHGQAVLNHLPRDSRHIRQFPREHIGASLEEGDERAFLFFA
jgi:hypothetical protein